MKVTKARCDYCHLGCGVLVHSDNGKILKIEGNPDDPFSRGYTCVRAPAAIEDHDHPDRLNYPLKRVGERGEGKWQRITWDQALDEIAEKLKQIKKKYGPEAITSWFGTGHIVCFAEEIWSQLFLHALGSPNMVSQTTPYCFCPEIPVHMAMFGCLDLVFPVPGVTKCVVVWGLNPHERWPIEHFALEACKAAGAKIIVIDPVYSETASKVADLWLQLRPNTDGALALAMINVIINEELYDKEFVKKWCYGFDKLKERVKDWTPEKAAEITWVPADKIREAARTYASIKPAVLHWGQKTNCQGKGTIGLIQAKGVLRAITGNLNRVGGHMVGPVAPFIYPAEMDGRELLSKKQAEKQLGANRHPLLSYPGADYLNEIAKKHWGKRIICDYGCSAHYPEVYDAMITDKPYPVKAAIMCVHEPLVVTPDPKKVYKALKSLDLLVNMNIYMTPTCMISDYVLPCASKHEKPYLWNFGLMNYIAAGERPVQPLYERKDEYWIWRELAIRMGLEKLFPWKTYEEAAAHIIKPIGFKSLKDFVDKGGFWAPPPEERLHEKMGKFCTSTGKVELYCTTFEKFGGDPLPFYEEPLESPVSTPELAKEYPFILIAGRRRFPLFHSQYRQIPSLRRLYPWPMVRIHPDPAREYGIRDGDWVIVESRYGKIKVKAQVTGIVHPNVIDVDHGWWFPEAIGEDPVLFNVWESNVEMLIPLKEEWQDPLLGATPLSGCVLCKVYPMKDYTK